MDECQTYLVESRIYHVQPILILQGLAVRPASKPQFQAKMDHQRPQGSSVEGMAAFVATCAHLRDPPFLFPAGRHRIFVMLLSLLPICCLMKMIEHHLAHFLPVLMVSLLLRQDMFAGQVNALAEVDHSAAAQGRHRVQ